MKQVYNFSSGPSCLPKPVLEKAKNELLNYNNFGVSVMEMSHRSQMFQDILDESRELLAELIHLPDNYKIIFVQGGATLQFSMIPMNLLQSPSYKADYINTDYFANKAIEAARPLGNIVEVASSIDKKYAYIPKMDTIQFSDDASYIHITQNNTVSGTRYIELPKTDKPIVSDLSSCILAEEIDLNDFGLIYAGAQKNLGPSGVTVVIVREDLVGNPIERTPEMMDYKAIIDQDSMVNTPPTYGIYMAGLTFKWLKELGGVKVIEAINKEKAGLLYDFIDNSKLYKGHAEKEYRSYMNITFNTGSKALDDKFVKEAYDNGLINIKGHAYMGGMRASIYNAMPIEGVKTLITFMKKFERENAEA